MSDNFLVEQLFYNGTVTLVYDDFVHTYTVVEGEDRFIVPTATGVCAMIAKDALVPWAAKMVTSFISEHSKWVDSFNDENDCYWQSKLEVTGVDSQETWDKFLQEAKTNFRKISEEALDVGSLAHAWLEEYTKAMIEGVEYNAPLPANDAACRAITSALDWHAKHNFRPIAAEKKVYSRELNTAGTFDWIAFIDSCDDPKCCKIQFKDKLALGDYKSSKAIYDEYKIQTAFYKFAVDEEKDFIDEGDTHIEARVILRLGKSDGEFESMILMDEEDYQLDLEAFLGALKIYSWKEQNSLNNKAEKQRLKALKPKKTPVKRIKIPKVESIPVVNA